MLSLLTRAPRGADPTRTYYLLRVWMTVAFSLFSTVSLVYMVTVVGLDPLQMVLVGTVLETTCFLFEIPTGIVADLHSRRLSNIIGVVLMGCGFLLQGLVPTFVAVLAAQVLWGIGYTFTSGAIEAWITDEVGDQRISHLFTRGQQLSLAATFVATVAAGGFGLIDIRLPMVIAGGGFILLGVVLLVTMVEDNFHPTPRQERETFRHMASTFVAGLALARRKVVVRAFFVISLIVGLSSEAFDRLWTVRVLEDFTLPSLFGSREPVLWFAVFTLIGSLVSLAASLIVNRVSPERVNDLHPNRILAVLALIQVAGIVGLALIGHLWLALAAMWAKNAAAAIAAPIEAAWLNRNVESRIRATVLSMTGQADAVGQVIGGPPLGALANRTSVAVALMVSAGITAPITVIYARLRPQRQPTDPAADRGL